MKNVWQGRAHICANVRSARQGSDTHTLAHATHTLAHASKVRMLPFGTTHEPLASKRMTDQGWGAHGKGYPLP